MGAKTKIEWAEATWNPLAGCSRVSEGCRNCYAERMAARFSGKGQPYEGLAKLISIDRNLGAGDRLDGKEARWTGEVRLIEEALDKPLHWRKPRRIFVNSMSDLFHEKVPDEWIERIWTVMDESPQHTFQILTKRPERMREWVTREFKIYGVQVVPAPHIWLGVSVEDQKAADERIPLLLQTPAAVRWVSYEPALGAVDFSAFLPFYADAEISAGPDRDVLRRRSKLDWIVCGGESGPGARPMRPDWARWVRDQCVAAGIPYFFKQWGEFIPACSTDGAMDGRRYKGKWLEGTLMLRVGKKKAGRLLDGREWNEFPETIHRRGAEIAAVAR